MSKKVTIEDILKKKKIIEETSVKPFYSEFFGGEIEIEDIPVSTIARIIQNSDETDELRADYELVYTCCPIFRSKELLEEYDVKDPIDIVGKLYKCNITELSELTKHILNRYGIFIHNGVETVKKQ